MEIRNFVKLATAMALMWTVGCQNGPDDGGETPTPAGDGVKRFAAEIVTPEVTRASLKGDNTPTWRAGDDMLVLSYGDYISQIKAVADGSSVKGTTAMFDVKSSRAIPRGQETYAVHPYFQTKLSDVNGGGSGARLIKFSLGEQTPNFDEKLHLPLLVGKWDDASESFKMNNPLLVVRVKLSLPTDESDLHLTEVKVTGNNGETLWGSAATLDTSDMSVELAEEGALHSLSLECSDCVLGAEGKSLSFCIPAQEYSKGLKMQLLCKEGRFETDIEPDGINLLGDSVLEKSLTVNLTKSDIFLDVVRATDTTVAVAWSHTMANLQYLSEPHFASAADYTGDIAKEYKVAIYSDEECSQLVYSASVLKGEKLFFVNGKNIPPRFVFTGLEPSTDYYVHIYNLTDAKQSLVPLKVTTAASIMESGLYNYSEQGDVILFENFGDFIYGGDNTVCAAGISRSDRGRLTSFDGVELKDEVVVDNEATDGTTQAYVAAPANIEMGLFNTLKGLVDDMDMANWGWIGGSEGANGGSVCARPGYVKIGVGGNRSFIVTPMLSGIPSGVTAKVTVKFKAAPYGDPGNDIKPEEKEVAVKVLNDTSLSGTYQVTYGSEGESKKLTLSGDRCCDWEEYSVTLSGVSSTSRIAIGGGRQNATDTNRFLLDDITISVDSTTGKFVSGVVAYDDGTPAADVVVSDGFTCVKTDKMGRYSFVPHEETWYIFYSTPSDCEVNINHFGQPQFYTKYDAQNSRYDFVLKKLPVKEDRFALFCLADVQCANVTHINRFKNESIPDISSHVAEKDIPCYGVTLGDVVYSQGTRNCESMMPTMRDLMAKDNIGMPVFQTFGNHDYSFIFDENNPLPCSGYQDLSFQLKAQRSFENVFGPINYSWNRGDTHIVSMRNLLWWDGASWDHYSDPRFLDAQYEWLKQDLAHVPTDKMVILCVHCSIWNTNRNGSNVPNILNLLSKYKEAHIMSGHHHRNTNEPTKSTVNGKAIYEHNHGAVCGHFWRSKFNADGSPNGYGVYEIEGNKMVDWYYKGVNSGMNDRNYQMRVYRGNLRCGGQYDYVQLQHGANVILANIFNSDKNWNVQIYEDGVLAGNMELMDSNASGPCKYSPDENNPGKPSVKSSLDWWLVAYHTGVLGMGDPKDNSKHEGNYKECTHMYKWTLKNPNAKSIKVKATDSFGNVYECSEITGDYDYSVM
ncbi:MAG: calcineurin-like phosphoesterase C-terminal domain-containing protein [Alistipes sp.]|nr:calcineurin-like phosphoesterase C-terminal domain-containing protein [Alistipes sp.]